MVCGPRLQAQPFKHTKTGKPTFRLNPLNTRRWEHRQSAGCYEKRKEKFINMAISSTTKAQRRRNEDATKTQRRRNEGATKAQRRLKGTLIEFASQWNIWGRLYAYLS